MMTDEMLIRMLGAGLGLVFLVWFIWNLVAAVLRDRRWRRMASEVRDR